MAFTNRPVLLTIVVVLVVAAIFLLEYDPKEPEVIQDSIKTEVQDSVETIVEVNDTEIVEPIEFIRDTSKADKYEEAPEFTDISNWINSEPLTMEELRGKVVLIDFWTYSCINCIRTLPYINAWDEKYKDDGLVIVGVHAPEFFFEEKTENVEAAIDKYDIKYPVAQDNNKGTWKAYQNRYWPRKYLVDIDGYIRYDHIGEGAYETTEQFIQDLLKERKERLKEQTEIETDFAKPNATGYDYFSKKTPELYFGNDFSRRKIGNPEDQDNGATIYYTLPEELEADVPYLQGSWRTEGDYMELSSDSGQVVLDYKARVVNIVAESEDGSQLDLLLDGEPVSADDIGVDADYVTEPRLYNLIDSEEYGNHNLTIKVKGKGFHIFTFTFG